MSNVISSTLTTGHVRGSMAEAAPHHALVFKCDQGTVRDVLLSLGWREHDDTAGDKPLAFNLDWRTTRFSYVTYLTHCSITALT